MATTKETREKTMLELLREGPQVPVRIPLEHVEDERGANQVVPVMVNGIHQQIARGETVEIPVPMYLALRQTGRYDI